LFSSKRLFEEYAYILDFLPHGYSMGHGPLHLRRPLAQAIGEEFFTLLELIPKEGVTLTPGERVFIGKGVRDKIDHISRRITYADLTPIAKGEVERVIENVVKSNEARFIAFFNTAQPITTRMHSLSLLPSIGRRRVWEILNERKKSPFKSFKDVEERVKLKDVSSIIVKRILLELQGGEKYYLFVRGVAPTVK